MRKYADNSGSSAWVQYIAAKLANPALHTAAVTRRYPLLPTRCVAPVRCASMAAMLRGPAKERK
jgi:hypothetical protein